MSSHNMDGPSGSKQNNGPGPLPHRWLYCPRISESLIAERFLAFKTPLSNAFQSQMPIECSFPPEMIFSWSKTLKIKLGLWIDLTNTKRFYDRAVVEKNGAQYVKLQCRGHGETPSKAQTESFIQIVDSFVNEHPMELVGVHCTHGFNRTGFLIISYLVERLDFSVEAALMVFAKARPPGIYKQDYINELFSRYEEGEDPIQAPELPNWHNEFDDSDSTPQKRNYDDTNGTSNGYEEPGDEEGKEGETEGDTGNGVSPKKKKRRKELYVKNPTFMSGVPGVTLVEDQPRLGNLQRKVQEMCSWDKSGFPGCQPVSMDRKNYKRLSEIPYRVSWKADGMRYMMLINGSNEIYFFDRNHSCFQVENLTFPNAENLKEHLKDTLIDGEMVLDKHEGQTIPRYLIYDIITISNYNIAKKPFYPDRLYCIRKTIIDPRHEGMRRGIINRPSEPFGVRHKEFWDIKQAESLLSEKFAKSLLHEPDGLIFQPSKQPYTAGVCPDVLKWKPTDMNSVDFRLKIGVEGGQGILPKKIGILYVGGYDSPFCQMNYTKALKDLDNKIIECTVNHLGQWEFMRQRTDKTLPNSYNTATAVIDSIRHPITKDFLIQFIAKMGYRDESEMMPPPKMRRPAQLPANHHQQQQHQQLHIQKQQQQGQQQHEHHLQQQHQLQQQQQHLQEEQHHHQIEEQHQHVQQDYQQEESDQDESFDESSSSED